MKKVLVTGADGFIGSHLTESLLEMVRYITKGKIKSDRGV